MFKKIRYDEGSYYNNLLNLILIDDDFEEIFLSQSYIYNYYKIIDIYTKRGSFVGKNVFLVSQWFKGVFFDGSIEYARRHHMYESFREDFEKLVCLM